MISVYFSDEAALAQYAQDFARALKPGDCITLDGDLGVGKTTFCRSVIRANAADFDDKLDVPSPTFTIVQNYDGALPIAHFDLYRIADPDELDELGLETALENGVALIEWPSRARDYLPDSIAELSLSEVDEDDAARTLNINAPDEFFSRCTRSLAIRDFLNSNGRLNANRIAFPGDASVRDYEYIQDGNVREILMDAPRVPDGPPIYDGLPYSQVVHLAEEVRPFVAISQLLLSNGFCAPEILAHDLDAGLLLLDDLGDQKIVDEENQPIAERYLVAIETLAAVHSVSWPHKCDLPDGSHHIIPRYDVRAMRTGLSLLPDWWGKENGLSESAIKSFYELWLPIFERFQTGYNDLIVRDYHSPNIIWRGDKIGHDRIGIIDHQDALIGPGLYDVASLTQDARTTVSLALQKKLLDHYCAIRKHDHGFDEEQARLDIATLCAFRNSRLLGLWVRLDLRDAKPRFRRYEAQTRLYLQQALSHPELADLRAWYLQQGVING